MTKVSQFAAGAVVLAAILGVCPSCSSKHAATAAPACEPGGDGTYVEQSYDELSKYCMVDLENGDVAPMSARVVPYELSTPLFSDYAIKRRTVWTPPGTAATYSEADVFDFPVGTIFTKSFGFPRDPSQPEAGTRWLETRVLIRGNDGWKGTTYLWNEEQTIAKKQPGGTVRSFDVRADDGSVQHAQYLVPSEQQCPKCHGKDGAVVPIGPRGRAFSGDQIARWAEASMLTGAPSASPAPLPAWNDTNVPVETRARAYLEGNCAYCHNPKGEARTTGLFLNYDETDATHLGTCKSPVAAGTATANLHFDVVPGKPDESLLLKRMLATEPAIAMPEIGRSVVHTAATDLIRAWISAMPGDCSGN